MQISKVQGGLHGGHPGDVQSNPDTRRGYIRPMFFVAVHGDWIETENFPDESDVVRDQIVASLAQYVKNKNALAHEEAFPEAAKAIIENHYVDDYLGGADSLEEAEQLIRDVIHVHSEGGLRLTKFVANNKEVLRSIPAELTSSSKVAQIDEQERVLGIGWNSEIDCFLFQLKFVKVDARIISGDKVPTKREVLKTAMSLYDPLGFLVPVTIKSKIFLQQIWRSGIGWDDEINTVLYQQWKEWLLELKKIRELEIQRYYSERLSEAKSIELHTFCDASEDAYAAVVYLRIPETDSDQIRRPFRAPLSTVPMRP
jgi:Arc/MetJ-type ribon-helix-helix transcriptional regulator